MSKKKGNRIWSRVLSGKANYIIVFFICVFLCGCVCSSVKEKGKVFQYSTINALLDGVYDGDLSVEELKKKGDFGIGTFNRLDGEMVVLDGCFYQIKANGTVEKINDKVKTPFVVLVFFEAEQEFFLDQKMDLSELENYLEKLLPSSNFFTAIKIEGVFDYVRTRSVPAQSKPYRPLVEVVKEQPTFEFYKMEGSLIGFRFPQYMRGLNVAGYHFHFISKDRLSGGHLLACRLNKVKIYIDHLSCFCLKLPESQDFSSLDLGRDMQEQLHQAEK